MPDTLPFRQVDVFSEDPLLGNPVSVVHDADGLDEVDRWIDRCRSFWANRLDALDTELKRGRR